MVTFSPLISGLKSGEDDSRAESLILLWSKEGPLPGLGDALGGPCGLSLSSLVHQDGTGSWVVPDPV